MAKDKADFHVTTYSPYGNEYDLQKFQEVMEEVFGKGGGGVPWFHKPPSPTYPNNAAAPPATPGSEPPPDTTTPANDWQWPLAGMAGGAAGFLGLSAKDWMRLIAALAGGAGALTAGNNTPKNLTPNTTTMDPQIQALLKTQNDRLNYSNPLYQAVMNMGMGLLPTSYQLSMPNSMGGPGPGTSPPTGGLPKWPDQPPVQSEGMP